MQLRLPSWATTLLGLVAGVLAILNEVTFGLSTEWRGYVSMALIFLAGLGISPLVGPAFRSALHVSNQASIAVSSVLAGLALVVHGVDLSTGLRGVLQGILTFAAAVGFAPAAVTGAVGIRVGKHKLGRLPAFRPQGLKDFVEYATRLPAPPVSFPAPKGPYPIDGNDKFGDCTIAGVAHLITAWNRLFGQRDVVPTELEIDNVYFKLTGGKDTGLVEANVLSTWQKIGLFGQKIAGYAPVKKTDMTAVKQAIAFYGGCYLGIECPESAQQQFEEGRPWTYIPGSPVEGGHCIVALGFTRAGDLECATWGGIVLVTPGFLKRFLEEAWVILPHQLVEAKKDSLGLELAELQADLASV